MSEFLIVGVDGSPDARRAALWAAAEAELRGARLRIVGCVTTPTVVSPWTPAILFDEPTMHQWTAETVAEAAALIAERFPHVPLEQRVVTGTARYALADEADGAALLVVGSHGAGATESLLLGSVAHAVIRTSPCPVAIVPPGSDDAPATASRRIAVGVDGSRAADAALTWAVDEADRRDAELVVLHGWEYPYRSEHTPVEKLDLVKVDAALVLDAAVERARERGRGPVTATLVHDHPAAALVGQSADCDLVVVGSRGRGGFRSLLFGSVAHAVTVQARCPVVVVRSDS